MSQSLAAQPPVEADIGFAAHVREHTRLVHREAERAGFIADLLHGRATKAGYALFLRNLHPAYAALGGGLASWADGPLAGAFADPRLRRLDALTADLHALAGADWPTMPVLAEATTYANAIAMAAADPSRVSGHAYARYLGDLSGGQILKPLLARMLGLGPDALQFYDFSQFSDINEPKLALRTALDHVPTASVAAHMFCQEAVAAFRHNMAVSLAVQAALAQP